MPSLYNFTQSFIVIMDRRTTHRAPYDRELLHTLLFHGISSFTQQNLDPGTAQRIGALVRSRHLETGILQDRKILPCDSYLEVILHHRASFFVFLIGFISSSIAS